jgi:protein involved in polysaccharide export with SLBB domain
LSGHARQHLSESASSLPDANVLDTVPEVRVEANEIRPGDELVLTSASDAKLNSSVRVGFDGIATFPYKVVIQTNMMQTDELEEELKRNYLRFYKSPPKLKIHLNPERRVWVDIRGNVLKPQKLLIENTLPLQSLVELAGGMPIPAGKMGSTFDTSTVVSVLRKGSELRIDYLKSTETPTPAGRRIWAGGDTIVVQSPRGRAQEFSSESPFVTIIGDVRESCTIPWTGTTTLLRYLTTCKGPVSSADLQSVVVFRNAQQDRVIRNMEGADAFSVLEPGDTVLVPAKKESKIDFWLRVSTSLLSAVNSILLISLVL